MNNELAEKRISEEVDLFRMRCWGEYLDLIVEILKRESFTYGKITGTATNSFCLSDVYNSLNIDYLFEKTPEEILNDAKGKAILFTEPLSLNIKIVALSDRLKKDTEELIAFIKSDSSMVSEVTRLPDERLLCVIGKGEKIPEYITKIARKKSEKTPKEIKALMRYLVITIKCYEVL